MQALCFVVILGKTNYINKINLKTETNWRYLENENESLTFE